MAQFDVYSNPSRQRRGIPYVVLLQSNRYEALKSRLVAAIVERDLIRTENPNIAPAFTVDGLQVVLDVFNLAVVPADRFGRIVASLADEDSRAKLVRAMDELLSQA